MTNEEFIQSISLEGEEWKDVVGYEGLYMVSSLGRVASIRTEKYYKNATKPQKVEQHLKTLSLFKSRENVNYYIVLLYSNGKGRTFKVHRLVAKAFIPNPHKYPQIDHLNTDGTDNRVENLKWCSNSMNMRNPLTLNKLKRDKTYLNGRSKKVIRIVPGEPNKIYNSVTEAAKDNNVSRNTVKSICLGRTVIPRGAKWMYLSDYESLINKSKNSLPAPITADYPQ